MENGSVRLIRTPPRTKISLPILLVILFLLPTMAPFASVSGEARIKSQDFAILDETDSGLDIDALKVVAAGVNALRCPEKSVLMITHYQRLLDHVVPDRVHVLSKGVIVRSGGGELALKLEDKGYGWLDEAEAAVD